jgi:molecular chaperone GrpE
VSESRETQDETTEPGVEEEVQAVGTGLPLEPPESAAGRLGDQLQDAQDRYLRLAAEFDNFRKRVARERIELADRAQSALVARLLDVIDDLDRLAAQDISQTGTDVLHEALVLLDRKLRKELEAAGLTGIDPVGTAFDPSVHEAVSVLPAPDPAMDQQVSATFQTGYLFKGALVRPARVQVYSADA